MRFEIFTLVLQTAVFLTIGGVALAQKPSTTRKSSKSPPKRELKSMGQHLYPEGSGFVPEPPPFQPMGGTASQRAALKSQEPTTDYPPPPMLDGILRDAPLTPAEQVIQSLITYRNTTRVIYPPRRMLVSGALEHDQRWIDAFLTYMGTPDDPLVMRGYYNELLEARRARIRDWFQTQAGEKASGVREAPVMKELRTRLDDFGRNIWDAEENELDVIDDWNDLQSELAKGEVVSIAVGPDATKRALHASSQEIEFALPRQSAFLDVVKYRKLDDNNDWHYCAFVLAEMEREKKTQWNNVLVRRVDLGKCLPIDAAITIWLDLIKRGESDRTAAEQVSRKIWLPLSSAFPTTFTSAYVCADGRAGEIPFAALPISRTELLIDKAAISTLPFAGFLAYSKLPLARRFWGKPQPLSTDLLIVRPDDNLLHANKECEQIAQVARDLQLRTKYLNDREATPSNVLNAISGTAMAHFAAHGIVASSALKRQRRQGLLPNGEDANPLDSLLFSSLLLDSSGASKLSNRVLTAEQLSRIDCRGLRLVTLAACDSGKGDSIMNGGVMSLVTGTHLGGADNVIATYWKVGDEESSQMMTAFYTRLLTGGTPLYSLRYAQRQVRDKGAKTKDWAGYFHSGAGF